MSAAAAVEATDLAELLNELAGAPSSAAGTQRWHCLVPSHDDENPSTTVFEDSHGKERWKCWSCGCGGTAIDALVEARSMTVAEAITTLEERTGTASGPVERPTPRAPRGPVAVPLSADAERYLWSCAELLWDPEGGDARNWLRQRGLDDDVLKANLVGFDPGPSRLKRAAGLPGNMMRSDAPNRRQGLPGGTGVTFVSFDQHGAASHVQCRLLSPHNFKYANPRRAHGSIPAVSFPKTSIDSGPVLVTEGVADGLIAVTAGFRAATVTAATTVRASTAEQLTAYAAGERIVLAFDNDPAGRGATAALKTHLGSRASVLQLPTDHDLTDTYRNRRSPQCQTTQHSHTTPPGHPNSLLSR